jgi:periplasmic protein TonB
MVRYQGTAVLWIVVTAQGDVAQERLVKPLGLGLGQNALRTVRTWKFKPATRNGVPVPVRVMVEVSFRLF